MGISSRSTSSMGIISSARNLISGKNSAAPRRIDSRTYEHVFQNCYSLDSILKGAPGEYGEMAQRLMRSVMEQDFSALPFEDSFPFRGFVENNTIFSLSPIPGMIFSDESEALTFLKSINHMDLTLVEAYDYDASLRRMNKFPKKEKRRIFGDLDKFNRELVEELDTNILFGEAFAERWMQDDGEILLSELREFRRNWDSLFCKETDYDGDSTIVSISRTLEAIDDIGTVVTQHTGTDPDDTILSLPLIKQHLNETLYEKGDGDAVGKFLSHWVRKLEVKREEVIRAQSLGASYGQIGRAGGSYNPHTQNMQVHLVTNFRTTIANAAIEHGEPGETYGIADMESVLQRYPEIREKVVRNITGTLLHEYAHHVSFAGNRADTGIDFSTWAAAYAEHPREDLPSDYSMVNPCEGYAEVFAKYWEDVISGQEKYTPPKDLGSFVGA